MTHLPVDAKVAAVVILFHPADTVVANIASYHDCVERVYVFDNTEQATVFDWSALPRVEYHHDGTNKGLAFRLNEAVTLATQQGYGWLLTMDQDSSFRADMREQYFTCFNHFANREQVALFGPVHCPQYPAVQPGCAWQYAERIVTSGALLNLALVAQIGAFDEALFIDSVDCDYCIRARLGGYKVVQFTSIFMLHELGKMVHRSSIKTLFLFKKNKAIHSPLRYYYMVRNYLYLSQKFGDRHLKEIKEIKGEVKDRIMAYILYGRDSRNLFRHIALARKHFREGKMGKKVQD